MVLPMVDTAKNVKKAVPASIKASSQAGIYAERALQMMKSLGVLPIPQHYSVFFAFAAGQPTGLVKELERAIAAKEHLGEEFLSKLYASYIADPQTQAVQDSALNAKRILSEIMQSVGQFEGATAAFSKEISEQLDTMDERISEEMVRMLAQSLVDGAQAMKSSSESVSQRLAASQREIADLRENLAQAMTEAERDFLTGTYNRKAFDKRLNEAMVAAKAEKTELVLLMLDIDHFKSFNDSFGHLIGDEVLKIVAKTLVETLKGMDSVARYGGEEFAVILPKTPVGGGMVVAEAIRKSIAGKELKRKTTGENFGVITVSIGVASFRPEQDTPTSLITRADEALYRSKKGGRNRVTQEMLGKI